MIFTPVYLQCTATVVGVVDVYYGDRGAALDRSVDERLGVALKMRA